MNAQMQGMTAATHSVPFFTQAASFRRMWPEIRKNVDAVFDRGKYSHGQQVAQLERAIADYTGARFALGVNSGTDALVLLLRALGVGPGDEVIVPAYTFFATASAVALVHATPVFADITADGDYAMDLDSAAAAVTARTRAVLPVHLFHQLADLQALTAFARRHGIDLIEDSAEAIGMRWNGIHAGLHGRGGVLSFFPTKTLGALGDAGMVITDDPDIADRVQTLRHHGRMGRTVDHIAGISNLSGSSGTNSKMDDIQAAILLAKLTTLDADIDRRAALAARYDERLAGIDGVLRTPRVLPRTADTNPVFYVYLIEVERRDELAEYLTVQGIGTEIYYPRPLPEQPCFANERNTPDKFPHATAASRRAIALPFYPDLTEHDIDVVCDTISAFYRGDHR
ncbi:DegT/DnrJ/EryC1/StrS family aminotransferase [Nocardia terpenica]|nr:DegT/DnrJ/EryC1/StrS family aminotransferase [Nocardia terpenica]MBF6104204.1 DegT/DnrJ/EryC1/StrS family aminotransferase [Nocardia terpenica]MBF6109940.1 DegT/DnrJ/EryC1/StrS family aminotransferase [Nocardia terpenica]MBF6120246.1 DegT/DnrJ/EryC1/StrS family aminotransferase [Nocardia terpenica]MBF6152657.1 DegT/DnrJ/EryC1/StrS family aminotransferase [Nocardia terpenica]